MTETVHLNCSFCNKPRNEVEKLIVTEGSAVCNECIELCSNILRKEKFDKLKQDPKINRALDPVKIKDYLDQYVIGQDDAKITLSVAVVNHFKRIYFQQPVEIEKSNILMFGPSGSGKTLLAKSIARYLDIPFVIADATTLTEAGYVGDDVDSVISRLLAEADYDVARCQQGIVFLDEIDKVSRKSESATLTRDVSGEGVQQALLKLVEGTKCRVSVGLNKKHPNLEQVEVDTTNILFIAGGAFTELDDIIAKRQTNRGVGFSASIDKGQVDRSCAEPDDFVRFGMIPEFTGRFPVVTYTAELTKDHLIAILTDTKNSVIKQMQFYFEADGIDLVFDSEAIEAIAEQALVLKTGARGLKAILEKLLNPYMFGIATLKEQGIKTLTIDKDLIKYTNKNKESQ